MRDMGGGVQGWAGRSFFQRGGHPDPGSLVNVRTLGAKSLPIQEVFEAFFKSYITS